MSENGFVYIIGSRKSVLYIGVTSHLEYRMHQHKCELFPNVIPGHCVSDLLYYEPWSDIYSARVRMRQIRRWTRSQKIALIASLNPMFWDLSQDWR